MFFTSAFPTDILFYFSFIDFWRGRKLGETEKHRFVVWKLGETEKHRLMYSFIGWLLYYMCPNRGLNLQPWWIVMMLYPTELFVQGPYCSISKIFLSASLLLRVLVVKTILKVICKTVRSEGLYHYDPDMKEMGGMKQKWCCLFPFTSSKSEQGLTYCSHYMKGN